jgi:hypothetical protein
MDLPTRDQLLPYLLDPAYEEKTIDPAPETIVQGLRRKETAGRSWIFWVIGVLAALVMAGIATVGLSQRKTIRQTGTPPNEKQPLLLEEAFKSGSPKPVRAKLKDPQDNSTDITPAGDAFSPEPKAKKKNNRRRVRGKKKQIGSVSDDEEDSITGSPKPKSDKPLPELPRAISTTALEDESDKERLIISDEVIGMSMSAFTTLGKTDR